MKNPLHSTEEKKVEKSLLSVNNKNMKKTKESSDTSYPVDDDMLEVAEILVALSQMITKRVAALPCSPLPDTWGCKKNRYHNRECKPKSSLVHHSKDTESQSIELTEEMMEMVLLVRKNEEKLQQKDIRVSQYGILKDSTYQFLDELERKLEQLSSSKTPKKTDLKSSRTPPIKAAASEGEEKQETVMVGVYEKAGVDVERLASSFGTSTSCIYTEPKERLSGLNPLDIDSKMSNHTEVFLIPDLNLPAEMEMLDPSKSFNVFDRVLLDNGKGNKLIFKIKKQP